MSCPVCNSDDSNSPTGSWCNTCGYQSPCPCWKGDSKACMDFMNEKRAETGYRPLAEKCCCTICETRPTKFTNKMCSCNQGRLPCTCKEMNR